MAQVVAHLIGNEEVTGSTPVISLQEDDPSDHPFFVSKSTLPVVWTAKRPGPPGRQSPYIRWGIAEMRVMQCMTRISAGYIKIPSLKAISLEFWFGIGEGIE